MPDLFIIGGPNGAGKTTAARVLLPSYVGILQFVNADEIARGLSGFAPETVSREAGRIMLRRIQELARQHVDFAFETTLASRSFAPWLSQLQTQGFDVHIIYLWLPTAELAIHRVGRRVESGGHHVPEEIVRRRYERGRQNFLHLYAPAANSWEAYDNSGLRPKVIAFGDRQKPITVLLPTLWQDINNTGK